MVCELLSTLVNVLMTSGVVGGAIVIQFISKIPGVSTCTIHVVLPAVLLYRRKYES